MGGRFSGPSTFKSGKEYTTCEKTKKQKKPKKKNKSISDVDADV
jgi:hypothetical protein